MRHRQVNRYQSRYDSYDWYCDRYNPPIGPKPYGCLGFLGDVFMTAITSGLWLIWIFIREMRRRNVRYY
jgi:hypothetical protein